MFAALYSADLNKLPAAAAAKADHSKIGGYRSNADEMRIPLRTKKLPAEVHEGKMVVSIISKK